MFVVEALELKSKRRYSRALIVVAYVNTSRDIREVRCLVDFETKRNFVSQTFVKKSKLFENQMISQRVQIVDNRIISSYDTHRLNIELIDHVDTRQHESIEFQVVNMREYEMILEFSWLNDVDLDINWREQTWTYRDANVSSTKKSKIKLCTIDEFAQLTLLATKKKDETYVVMFYQLLSTNSLSQYENRETTRCKAFQSKEKKISAFVKKFAKMFSKTFFDNLNTYDQMKHAIDLIDDKMSRIESIYNMSQNELRVIKNYLASALKKKWIRSSNNSTRALVLFVKKSNDSLRLCVNYRDLNEIIVKNKYSLSLLSKTLNRFAHAKRFIKIDIRNVYHRIRIRKNDEWKTTFRTCYDQFEYQVMSFELANAFAIFQFYVNHALKSYIDVFCVMYLDDVLIYSENETQH